MDDWVILAPTRWKLRRAIKVVNQMLTELKVEKHPDKTFTGRIERGFDFLGYTHRPRGWASPRRRFTVFRRVWPGFMSKVRTRSASGNTRNAGGVGWGLG
jgi:hypothetical protein